MKRLNLTRAPRWVDVDGVLKLRLRPMPTELLFEALRPMFGLDGDRLQAGEADWPERTAAVYGTREVLLRMIEIGVAEWNVVDEDEVPLPVTRKIATLMLDEDDESENPQLTVAMVRALVMPAVDRIIAVSAEKKASAPSRNGTTAAAPDTAAAAPAAAPSALTT